ncbi:hypothetical protein ACO1O0_005774 [Amphichorda felina]
MTKIRCHRCYVVCNCYFEHCLEYLCHIDSCAGFVYGRNDRMLQARNGSRNPCFDDGEDVGQHRYILNSRWAADDVILMRLGYQRSVLILEVEELDGYRTKDLYWLYVKPVAYTGSSERSEWAVGNKPEYYTPCTY